MVNQVNYKKKGIRLTHILDGLMKDKNQSEIAKELGCSKANISKRLMVAKKKGLIHLEKNSVRNFWRIDEKHLTKIIGDDLTVKDGHLELHQFDVKCPLWHPKYISILEDYFTRSVTKNLGKKWRPRQESGQTFYHIPLYSKYHGKVSLRWCLGSDSITIQGISCYGRHYFEARDRALMVSFRIIKKLEEHLMLRFKEDSISVVRSGDFAYDPPSNSKLKKIVKGIHDNMGNVRIGNVTIDDSNGNGSHIEVKTDHKDERKRMEAIKNADNLAWLIYNADTIATKSDIQVVMDKIDHIFELLQKPKVIARRILVDESVALSNELQSAEPEASLREKS